jgi:hypothetical protein
MEELLRVVVAGEREMDDEEGEGEGDEGVGLAGGCCRERIDLDDAHACSQVQSGVTLRIRSDDFTLQHHRADCITLN